MENYFAELNNINVNGHTEQKNGLTYLSWAWAWGELKKIHPDAIYTVYENKDGLFYHTDGKTAWVKTGVTVNGIEHVEYLPVMDFRNKSIPVESINSFDVNKAIQRSLTKAVARHGLGLYIYAGEDLPEEEKEPEKTPSEKAKETREKNKAINEDLKNRAGLVIEAMKTLKRKLTKEERLKAESMLAELQKEEHLDLANELASILLKDDEIKS